MIVSKRDGAVAIGVVFMVYGGGMIHSSIPPLVVGVFLFYWGAFRPDEPVEAEPEGEEES